MKNDVKVFDRIKEFEDLGFGIFVHYGLYSVLKKGEWAYFLHNFKKEEYEKLMDKFDAKDFSGKKLATIAKNAGAKYITLTTRHHDGFSLYDTHGLNNYDSLHSLAKRDIVKDFADGCREIGIKPFFYHTLLDWHEPTFNNDFKLYKKYLRDSVEILCRNYGDVAGFWFDGDWSKTDDDWEYDKLYSLIRKYQSNAMIINNTGLKRAGEVMHSEIDSVTFEREKPVIVNGFDNKYRASEMSQVFGDHWGYAENDLNYKGLNEIITDMVFARKYKSNFLLNIGPKPSGDLRKLDEAILEEISKWFYIYGQSYYNTSKTNITTNTKDFVLCCDNKYYVFVFDLIMDGDSNVVAKQGRAKKIELKNCPKIISLKWLDNNKKIDFTQKDSTLEFVAENFTYGENYVVRVAEMIVCNC